MNLSKQTSQIFRGFDPWIKFQWVLAIIMLVSGCFTVSVVPFIRRHFGERYLSWINLFFGYTVVANFAFLGGLIGVANSVASPWAMTIFWLAFIAVSLFHRFEIWRKNRHGVEWHSRYMGTSLLPVPLAQETVAKWIEPVLVLVAGLFIREIAAGVGLWLIISAFSLLVNNHLIYHFERERVLDIRDAQIEARNMSGALAGRPAHETAGFVMAESNLQMIRQDSGLNAAFAALGDDFKAILDAPAGLEPDSTQGVA